MVLTVDIGNTNIVLGVFDQDELVFTARVSTDKNRTADEYSVLIHGIFEINGFDLSRFDGIILSSVVPQLNSVVAYALGRFTSVRIRTVGPGLRTGFRILADDPTELGSDMVCNVAGALSEFEGPLTIVDFGTATTFTVVNAQSDICGVIIAPGMRISAEALTGGTAQPSTGLVPPECTVGSYNFREEAGDLIGALQEANPDPQALLIEGMEEAGLGSDPSTLAVSFAWGATTADARTYAELFQQMWQETLGVTVELVFNDSATHMPNINSGSYQIASTSWGANPEPQFQLSRWSTATGGQSKWINEEYCQLVNEGISTMDDTQRLELYRQAEELLVSEAAIAPIYWTGSIRFSYAYVQGFSENVFDTTGMMEMYTSGR